MANNNDVVKYKRTINFNIGFLVFLIIIIYVLFNIFSYFTKNEIAKYQVQKGSIATNHVYQGIILREEVLEYAKETGYVDYYMKNESKASATDIVYSIDKIGNISNEIANSSNSATNISKESLDSISKGIDEFLNNYNSNKFSSSYTFFHNLNADIAYTTNTNALENLTDKINEAEANNTFLKYSSEADGIVVYEMDGYEDTTIEDILKSGLDYSSYSKTYFKSNTQVSKDDPIFKRITSEDWYIILPIDDAMANELNEKSSVTIRFCKDDFTTNVSCSVITENNTHYLKLFLRTGMIRYIEDRFVDVEIVMKSISGLKIPVSAITSKEFFTIPKEYFSIGNEQLIVKEIVDDVEVTKLITPTIYYETDNFYYIDNESISAGDIIQKPDSSITYIIGTNTDSLVGVYNVNKGYAVFKQINILYQNEEYAIIEEKTSYGVSQYDHIALDASVVKENQLVSK